MIIPEYIIELFNKSKKIISVTKNVNKLYEIKNELTDKKVIKQSKSEKVVDLKKSKKTKDIKKKIKKPRTLWVRRKKSA